MRSQLQIPEALQLISPTWSAVIDGDDFEFLTALSLSGNGDVLLGGNFNTELIFADATTFVGGDQRPYYALLEGTTGARLRSQRILGDQRGTARSLLQLPSDTIVVAGASATSGTTWGGEVVSGTKDFAYLAAFDAADAYLWHLAMDGPEADEFRDLDYRAGRLAVVGKCRGSTVLEPGALALGDSSAQDGALVVLDETGSVQWRYRSSGAGDDSFEAVVIHADLSVTTAGVFSGSYTFQGVSAPLLGKAFVVAHFTPDGEEDWALVFEAGAAVVDDLKLSEDGTQLYLVGGFEGGIDVGDTRYVSEGGNDALLIPINLPS